ncbi:FkbM family methyltransferase [Mesorhizobium sp. M0306]|uniref:FkbM family methyltransferase n=1 Tax=Mesorhizobium sp. M0306 TaxID=2956932 RepID=UPI00333A8800
MYNPDWLRYCKRVVRAALGFDHLLRPECSVPTQKLGSAYGGWVVAVEPLLDAPAPIVLSFGLGDDISFDQEISKVFGAKVFGFDPTPASLDWIAAQELPPTVRIYPLGISNFDGEQTFSVSEDDTRSNFSTKMVTGKSIVCNVRRYSTILDMLGLATIDVLKLDVEGAEHDVLPEVLGSDVLPRQILVEFHHWWHRTPVEQTYRTVEAIKGQGYTLFHVSPAGHELSFLLTR